MRLWTLSFLISLIIFSNASLSQENPEPDDSAEFEVVPTPPPVVENQDSDPVQGARFERITYSGTGCPQGSANSALSYDQKTLSLLFDRFIVEAGRPTSHSSQQKVCHIQISLFVPQGYRVQIVRLDYRGYNLVPLRGRTVYSTQFDLSERKIKRPLGRRHIRGKTFRGPVEGDYYLVSRIRGGSPWSKCGEAFDLQISSQVSAFSNSEMSPVVASLDTLDATSTDQLKYHLRWKRCSDKPEKVKPTRPPGRGRSTIASRMNS